MNKNKYPNIDGYPQLTENNFIHLLPKGAYVLVKTEDPIWQWDLEPVDEFQAELLSKCDGTVTVSDVINKLCKEKGVSKEKTTQNVCSYLENALWKEVITMSDTAQPSKITITGSKKFYIPVHMAIEVTTKCNLKCKHCYRESGPWEDKILNIKSFLPILSKLHSCGLRIVEITGGEPMLNPGIFDLIDFCVSHFETTALLTNGHFVDEKVVEKLRPYCESKKLCVSITIDSSTPKFHDDFRDMSGSWEKATKAVKMFSEIGTILRVVMNVVPGNMDDVENTVLLVKELGATGIGINMVTPLGRGTGIDWSKVPKEKGAAFMENYTELMDKYKEFVIQFPEKIKEEYTKGTTSCGAGYRSVALGPTGIVRPCVTMAEGVLDMGNIFENSIENIFANPLIEILQKTKPPREETCDGCEAALFCRFCMYRGLIGSIKKKKGCAWYDENTSLHGKFDPRKLEMIAGICPIAQYTVAKP
ncbi:MAG: radical SAM protein [Nanoarchaeota archaeon]|nr:radical SAM protein [Nanoarchaeota archaeon]MCG2718118.1 radical SAM protein [Nanoarchaeota archaeon]